MTEKTDCSNHKWIPLLGMDKKTTVSTSLFTCLWCGDLKVGKKTIKISKYRLDMGELPINNVAGIKLNEAPTNDQTASGLIVSMTYGESITIGDLLYFNSNGKVYKADADASSTYPVIKYPVMGLALATASSGSNNVLLHGIYKDVSRYDFTVGGVVYLKKLAGKEIQTLSSFTVTDDVIQVVGVATHADRIYFNPSPDYITHI